MPNYISSVHSSPDISPTTAHHHDSTNLTSIDASITSHIPQQSDTRTLSDSYIASQIPGQDTETPLGSSNISDISNQLGHQVSNPSTTQTNTNSISSPTTSAVLSGNSGTVNQQFSSNYEYQYKQQPMLPLIGQGNPYYSQQFYASAQKVSQAPQPISQPAVMNEAPPVTAQLIPNSQPMVTAHLPSSNPSLPSQAAVSSRFTPQEIQTLKQLLGTGEKFKWKQITKEINAIASKRSDGEPVKNISPTFVIKQYQSLLGLPNNQMYFGTLGSSLPYVVHGWDAINDVD